MKVTYSGFNLYGNVDCKEPIVASFQDFHYEKLKRLFIGHFFNVVEDDRGLFLHGFINKSPFSTEKIRYDRDYVVNNIVVNENEIYILYQNGKLYKILVGNNLLHELVQFLQDKDDLITRIYGANQGIICLTNKGCVYYNFKKIDYLNKDIIDVSVGREHVILLDVLGNVYTFGSGSRGQLGNGTLESLTIPTLIEALAGIKIEKIAAGSWHSCALSTTGDLYTWGWNQDGQLGLGDEKYSVVATPKPVDFPDFEENVTGVTCGSKHTVALAGKKLYGAGWNKYHQLGGNEKVHLFKMEHLLTVDDDNCKIKCGPWCTTILYIDN